MTRRCEFFRELITELNNLMYEFFLKLKVRQLRISCFSLTIHVNTYQHLSAHVISPIIVFWFFFQKCGVAFSLQVEIFLLQILKNHVVLTGGHLFSMTRRFLLTVRKSLFEIVKNILPPAWIKYLVQSFRWNRWMDSFRNTTGQSALTLETVNNR